MQGGRRLPHPPRPAPLHTTPAGLRGAPFPREGTGCGPALCFPTLPKNSLLLPGHWGTAVLRLTASGQKPPRHLPTGSWCHILGCSRAHKMHRARGKYSDLPVLSDLWLPVFWAGDHKGYGIRCTMRAKGCLGAPPPCPSPGTLFEAPVVQLRKTPSSTPSSSAVLPVASLCLPSPSSPLLQGLYVGIINHGYGAFV